MTDAPKLTRGKSIGFPCPRCTGKTRVTDSRPTEVFGAPSVRRRRTCSCGWRDTTYEIASLWPMVEKMKAWLAVIGDQARMLSQELPERPTKDDD